MNNKIKNIILKHNNRGHIVIIIPKSPLPFVGRYGDREKQNWFKQCIEAKKLSEKYNCLILICSNFKSEGNKETDYYKDTLIELGVDEKKIITKYQGLETIKHLEYSFSYVKCNLYIPIIVCTFLHFLRVWFICLRHDWPKKFKVCFGIPRPKEAVTDVALTPGFPIITLLKKEAWFIDVTTGFRKKGKV